MQCRINLWGSGAIAPGPRFQGGPRLFQVLFFAHDIYMVHQKKDPLGRSQFFCHLSVFHSEIVQICRGERLTYSGQVLRESVQWFKSY